MEWKKMTLNDESKNFYVGGDDDDDENDDENVFDAFSSISSSSVS